MNVDTAWENAKNGVSGVQKLTSADLPFADLGIDLAAALPGREKNKILNFDSLSPFEQQEHAFESLFPSRVGGIIDHAAAVDLLAREVRKKKPDLFVTYALIAAQQALDSSGLLNDAGILNLDNPFRAGVSFGSGIGGLMSTEKGIFDGILKGSKLALAGNFLPGMLPNMATGWIADQYRLAGISTAPNGACASGGQAIEDAFRYIKGGILDVSVAGAAEAALSSMMALRAFGLAALATGWEDDPTAASRPYDLKRNGFVIAEGAGALLLEDLAHAERRGAEPLAEIVSIGGSTCNPGSEGSPLTSGTVVGQRNSIQMALAMAGVSPDEIGWIKAHGTSTTVGDQIESRSITSAVRPDVPVTSLKSMIGHALGASLAQEVVLMVRALQSGVIPPTINLGEQDPQCKAQVVRELTRSDAQYALANTFGFGGVNRSVTLKRIA
jgi:3-oxoacyl-[acyl-carrier-protein] synthase II